MKLLMKHFYRGNFKTKLENWFHVFMMRQGGIIVVIYDPVATCVQDKSSVTFTLSQTDKYTGWLPASFVSASARPS